MAVPIIAGIRGRCPECGEGHLFGKSLDIDKCSVCGLDLRESNPGDGLSTLVFLIVGGIGCFGIVWSEVAWKWPIWLLIVVWPAVIAILSVLLLQPFKGLMVALLYRTQAAEAVTRWREEKASGPAAVAPPSPNPEP